MSNEVGEHELRRGEYLVSRRGEMWERLRITSEYPDQYGYWAFTLYDSADQFVYGLLQWNLWEWNIYYPGMKQFSVLLKPAPISLRPASHVRRVEL